MVYILLDVECFPNALELLEQSMKINLLVNEEFGLKMNRFYLLASHLNLRNYNINNAILYYEKYSKCIKLAYSGNKNDDKFIENIDKVLEGLKTAGEELKKKHNFVKGKENTKKIFDELIAKFVTKVGLDERLNNKLLLDHTNSEFLDYMIKNGLVKLQGDQNQLKDSTITGSTTTDKIVQQKEQKK